MTDARFEEVARTLGLADLDIAVGATIRPGTLIVPAGALAGGGSARERAESARPEAGRGAGEPMSRRSSNVAYLAGVTLPQLEGSAAPGSPAADLELSSLLGQGGMGAVWLGRQRSLDRSVAVKRLRAVPFAVEDAAALLTEARTTGALAHPAIVPVYALGVGIDGSPLLVMKPIEGVALDRLARDPDHPSWPELERRHGDRVAAYVEILMRVADALQFAHTRGFVHRDVKPENVMVGAFGEVYLLDWGVALARAATSDAEGAIAGTPVFMAPEMARAAIEQIDERTDVYLLGATLHALLTGTPRHEGTTVYGVLLAAVRSEPVAYDATVPVELAMLANRATSPDRESRPASALAMREALAAFLRHRASTRLSDEAERLLASTGASDGQVSEARFAFTMALREWPQNDAARAGLRRSLIALAEIEIARSGLVAARALSDRIEPRDPALDARVEQLALEVGERHRLEQVGRDEARDRDPRVESRQRVALAASIAVVAGTLAAAMQYILWTHGHLPSFESLLAADTTVLVVFVAAIFAFRGRLLANRWGRHASAFVLMGVATRVLTDLVGVIQGDTVDAVAVYAIVALTSGVTVGGLALTPRLYWAGATGVLASLAAALWPSTAVLAVTAMLLFTSAVLIDASRERK